MVGAVHNPAIGNTTINPINHNANMAPAKRIAATEADLEEDCGFKFRRVSKPGSAKNYPEKEEAPINSKRKDEEIPVTEKEKNKSSKYERRRRRSSFVSIATKAGPRPSSFSVSLSLKTPDSSVATYDYHKHLLPDLPGPIKMRQLIIWAIQKVSSSHKNWAISKDLIEDTIQSLFTNKINTSWYQRPAAEVKVESRIGPKNQEIVDCLQLYERYSEKLKIERETWINIRNQFRPLNLSPPPTPEQLSSMILPPDQVRDILLTLIEWFKTLPNTVDQLHWTYSVASSFENHARSYCEGVFQQIRAKLFGNDNQPAPMMLLRALSATISSSKQ